MSVPEIHTLTGAYAVDALTETERKSFERHLRDCEQCATESRSLQAAAASLAALVPAPASAQLRDRVLAQARGIAQLPAPTSRERFARRHLDSSRLWMAVAAVLTLVATGLGAVAVTAAQRAQDAERQVAELTDRRPELEVVSSAIRSGGTATLVATGENAVFAATDLPAPPGDWTYQLWVIAPGGTTESVGVLSPDPSGRLEHQVPTPAPGEAIALTMEPMGGSAHPTTMPLVTLSTEA